MLSIEGLSEQSLVYLHIRILEGNLESLMDSHLDLHFLEFLRTSTDYESCEVLKKYSKVLMLYLKGESDELNNYLKSMENSNTSEAESEDRFLFEISRLRLNIRRKIVDRETVMCFLKNHTYMFQREPWRGEIHFVAALAFESIGDFQSAKDQYTQASQFLRKSGALKKSIKALFNSLIMEKKQNPEKRFITEYRILIKKIQSVVCPDVLGVAYHNLSREYELIGALDTALKYINKSIDLLESHDYGGLNYYLAIAHRCQILLLSGFHQEAQMDFELASAAPFTEIKNSLSAIYCIQNVLLNKNEKDQLQNMVQYLTDIETKVSPIWKERIYLFKSLFKKNKHDQQFNLTQTESELISALATSPKDKGELIHLMYGERVDYSSAENRLKVLMSRLKRKKPELIVFQDGKYQISKVSLEIDFCYRENVRKVK